LFVCVPVFVGRITVLETHDLGLFSSTTVLMHLNMWPIDTVERYKKSEVMSSFQARPFFQFFFVFLLLSRSDCLVTAHPCRII
jgi:hypothetical protein